MKGVKNIPGYYLHLAACGEKALNNRSFVLGVEAPDILKKWAKENGGIEYARSKYNSLRTEKMPHFEELEHRINQKEKCNDGLHYGVSSNPNIKLFWNSLTVSQKNNPFYKGYCWHLLTDVIMYSRLDIDSPEHSAFMKAEVKKLHLDWDKTNAHVRDTYPDVVLPNEVLELNVVNFVTEGDLVYVDWNVLKEVIDFLRTFNPLNNDISFIINEVFNNI